MRGEVESLNRLDVFYEKFIRSEVDTLMQLLLELIKSFFFPQTLNTIYSRYAKIFRLVVLAFPIH